jgi:triphosphatase
MATEIELKLAIAADDVADLRRSGVLKSATQGRPVTRTLHNIYFDTAGRELAKRGMALRLRKSGRQWIQTFKCGGGSDGGLHLRDEFENVVRTPVLDLAALAATPAAALFADADFLAGLAPAFVTRFRRTTWIVTLAPGETAELALDQGEVTAGAASTPISEVEIELLEGDPAHLFDFARRLLADVPLRLENVTKAERGYRLLAPVGATPVRASPVVLRAAMRVPEAFATVAMGCVHQLQANERGVLASEDPEYIHQARVALRRLRSAFGIFRDALPREHAAALAERLRALGNALGGARDWDVFATETLPPVEAAMPGWSALAGVRSAGEARRREARRIAREAVASSAYTALLLDLVAMLVALARPVPPASDADEENEDALLRFARGALAKREKRVRRAGKGLAVTDLPALHALRIEAKKLRYATEFFQALLPRKRVRAGIASAADLQEILGRVNDAAVTAELLATLAQDDASLSHGTGIVLGWTQARACLALEHFDAAWARFAKSRRAR